jgi:hypothetical protein
MSEHTDMGHPGSATWPPLVLHPARLFVMLIDMRFSVVPVVCVMAGLCLSASGQTTSGQSGTTTAQPLAATTSATPQSTAPLQLENLPPEPHTPTPEEQAEQKRQQEVAAINRIATMEARWGAPMSTPGISVSMKEVSRTKTPEGTEITYQVSGTGFTPGEKVSLIRWPLDGSVQTTMDGLTVSSGGQAICGKAEAGSDASACGNTMQPDQPLEVKAVAAPGEAIRIALLDSEQKRGAATSVIPYPVSGADKGCKLQLMLGLKNAALVLLEGDGFPPNATITLHTESWGLKQAITTKSNADGHLITATMSGVKGHDSGETTISYEGTTCTPSLKYSWGVDSYKAQ